MMRWLDRVALMALVGLGALGCAAAGGSAADAGRDAGADAGRQDAGDFRDAAGRDSAADDAAMASDAGEADADVETDAGADVDGGVDAGVDAGLDAGVDSGMDAGMVMPTITLDGVVSDAEWMGATRITNPRATLWGPGVNELNAMRTVVRDGRLWVAIEGVVEATNGIVAYVDIDLPDATSGVAFADMMDTTGSLDRALNAGFVVPAGFRLHFGFGTRAMGTAGAPVTNGTTFNANVGWRHIGDDPADFPWVEGTEAPMVCGVSACETSILLTTLGVTSGDQLALFVRMTNATGDAFGSDQTLPEDPMVAGGSTQVVTMLHTVAIP